jgi:hypothetical protein
MPKMFEIPSQFSAVPRKGREMPKEEKWFTQKVKTLLKKNLT